jgi:hypothetical protein
MSDMQLESAFSLPSGFRFGEVSSATAFRDLISSAPSLGPLTAFTGTFRGNGFNTIFRPDQGSPTPLPIPATGDNLLELNLTRKPYRSRRLSAASPTAARCSRTPS